MHILGLFKALTEHLLRSAGRAARMTASLAKHAINVSRAYAIEQENYR